MVTCLDYTDAILYFLQGLKFTVQESRNVQLIYPDVFPR